LILKSLDYQLVEGETGAVKTISLLWALAGLAACLALIAAGVRSGRTRPAAWLVVLGIFMLAVEEPLLTAYWALSNPDADRDGMATLVTAPASAHLLDSAVFATAFMILLGWIAWSGLRRGDRWAVSVLTAAWFVVAATLLISGTLVYSRGLPLPTAGGRAEGAGYGWEQLVVGLFAWGAGLWLARRPRPAHDEASIQHQHAGTR
jgi:hypothetical protein